LLHVSAIQSSSGTESQGYTKESGIKLGRGLPHTVLLYYL